MPGIQCVVTPWLWPRLTVVELRLTRSKTNALHVDAVNPIDPFTTQLRLTGGRVLSYNYVAAIPEMPVGVYWSKKHVHQGVVEAFSCR
jgi:hypothetical protein